MLISTFSHIKGVGPKKEQNLWREGITTWYKHPGNQKNLLSELGLPRPAIPLSSSIRAFQLGDMDFFARHLPSSLHYRVALSFPEETLFLDIETTGLSVYYDIITLVGWSVGNTYNVFINGQDESELRTALASAKTVVTFNGKMFDIKFIKKNWPDMVVPPIHVDLRYLSKKVGLSGGQKAIEKTIGYKRNKKVENMLGESAPILWHKYRRGDKKALKTLINYNHEDIEGMKSIFDYCVSKIIDVESVPAEICPPVKFHSYRSKIRWASHSQDVNSISLPEFIGDNKPLCDYSRLNNLYPLNEVTILGVDLVSSEQRKSGCCVLKGNRAQTCCLMTDEEIIKLAEDSNVTLVSIDSPLSIPKGRTSFYDDDHFRKHGIMRHCERTLKKRGINVYPCLIPSMQKLTRRGMILAEKLRRRGIPVIECYPGAAQDIMMIPRKQAGLDYLVMGIKEFGILGSFTSNNVTHDELDAITAAIVGLFFMTGKFEALGNPLEEYLIIPDLNGDSCSWLSRTVFGLEISNLQSSQRAIADLENQGCDFFILDKPRDSSNHNANLVLRAANLIKEMNMNVDLLRKWHIKELMESSQISEMIAVCGIHSPGDQAALFEMFGPGFRMAESIPSSLHQDAYSSVN